jgi:ATP synthase I chain
MLSAIVDDATPNLPAGPADAFYAGALERMTRFMPVLALLGCGALWMFLGWRMALGFTCGCAIAYLNFHWLKRVVAALADKVVHSNLAPSSKGVVARFILRYFLMAAVAYVIFTVLPAGLNGLFAGLFLPVAAVFCEAVYEAYAALARGL